jgi:hypothetical protein
MKKLLAGFVANHPWLTIFFLLFILPVIASHFWWEAGGGRIPGGVYSSDNPELYNEILRKELAEQYRRNQL